MMIRKTTVALLSFALALQPLTAMSQTPQLVPDSLLRSSHDGSLKILAGSLYSLAPPMSQPGADPAYTQLIQEQVKYNSTVAGRAAREKVFVSGDQASDKFSSLFSYIQSFTQLAGLPKETAEFHRLNEELISELLSDMQADPSQFGMTAAEANRIHDLTDIPWEYLVDRIIAKNSTDALVWGGLMATLLTSAINTGVDKGRLFGLAVLQSVGVEPALMAFFTERGLKQIHVMHRLYSYMKATKDYYRSQNQSWDPYNAMKKFDPSSVVEDQLFLGQTFGAWVAALAAGTGTRLWLSRLKVEEMITLNLRKHLIKPQPTTAWGRLFRKGVTNAAFAFSEDSWKSLSTRVFQASRGRISSTRSKLRNSKTHNEKPFGPAGIGMTTLDFSITGASLYLSTYLILSYSSRALVDTHLIPTTSLQMALVSGDQFNSEFVKTTREFIYPMCYHLAYNASYVQSNDNGFSATRRIRACNRLISGMEGVHSTDPNTFPFENLAQQFSSGKSSLTTQDIDELVEKLSSFPADYRVTWMSMLRSIYPLDFVPPQFWKLQYRVLGTSWMNESLDQPTPTAMWRASTSSPGEISAMMNAERLHYAVEKLAILKTKMEINSMIDQGAMTGPKIAENDNLDSRLVESTTDLTEAFLTYAKHAKYKVVASQEEQLALAESQTEMSRQKTFDLAVNKALTEPLVSLFPFLGPEIAPEASASRSWEKATEIELDSLAKKNFQPNFAPYLQKQDVQ